MNLYNVSLLLRDYPTSDGSYRFTLGNEFTESRSQEGIIQRNHSLSRSVQSRNSQVLCKDDLVL
jgi:hypothetical protein